MTEDVLQKLFKHNNWANLQVIEACSALADEQLDAAPQSATKGTIRTTLFHLVTGQQGYLRLLTRPLAERLEPVTQPPFGELAKFASSSGEALLALVGNAPNPSIQGRGETRDGFLVEPWVILLQVINHAPEHRGHINSMLTSL